jgi:hypothetical protein
MLPRYNNNNNIFNLSSFTLSEANYLLTLGYHSISLFLFTCNYISFILLNHLFLTMSKYFPMFCICVLVVIFSMLLRYGQPILTWLPVCLISYSLPFMSCLLLYMFYSSVGHTRLILCVCVLVYRWKFTTCPLNILVKHTVCSFQWLDKHLTICWMLLLSLQYFIL